MSASYQVTDGVAVISLDNPPVNGLGQSTRAGIVDGIQKAQADAAVQAVVIIGSGKVFCGGADIREFGSPKAFAEPNLHVTIEAVERSAKPVVAAIHGVAMGGGLELALGCHYRVAVPSARFGFPEVNLGIIPGAGGTQRLTRVVGAAKAKELILFAQRLSAAEAQQLDQDLGDLGLFAAPVGKAAPVQEIAIAPADARYHWPLWVGKRWSSHFLRKAPGG